MARVRQKNAKLTLVEFSELQCPFCDPRARYGYPDRKEYTTGKLNTYLVSSARIDPHKRLRRTKAGPARRQGSLGEPIGSSQPPIDRARDADRPHRHRSAKKFQVSRRRTTRGHPQDISEATLGITGIRDGDRLTSQNPKIKYCGHPRSSRVNAFKRARRAPRSTGYEVGSGGSRLPTSRR